MAKTKTHETNESVTDFIERVPDAIKRADSYELIRMMTQATGCAPKMWGPSIIGFSRYHYQYESGHQGDAPVVGFSPRTTALTLYLYSDFEAMAGLLARFGKHKKSKACIYIKRLSDVDTSVLQTMIEQSIEHMRERYPD